MSRVIYVFCLCFSLLFLAGLSAAPYVGVDSVPAKNRHVAEAKNGPQKGVPKSYREKMRTEGPQVVMIDRTAKKATRYENQAESLPAVQLRMARPQPDEYYDNSQPNDYYCDCQPEDCYYTSEPDVCYEDCDPCCKPAKTWVMPAAIAAGIIGVGVYTAVNSHEGKCEVPAQPIVPPVGDLTFEFDFEFNSGDAGADIDFEIREPDSTVFQMFSLGSPTTNLMSNTISDVFAGDEYTVVATDFNATANLDVTFTMRAYLNAILFDTQVFEYEGGGGNPATPAPPQTFTFTVPAI